MAPGRHLVSDLWMSGPEPNSPLIMKENHNIFLSLLPLLFFFLTVITDKTWLVWVSCHCTVLPAGEYSKLPSRSPKSLQGILCFWIRLEGREAKLTTTDLCPASAVLQWWQKLASLYLHLPSTLHVMRGFLPFAQEKTKCPSWPRSSPLPFGGDDKQDLDSCFTFPRG